MNFKLILSIVMAGMAVLFIIQNDTVVELRLLFWTLSMSRARLPGCYGLSLSVTGSGPRRRVSATMK